MAEHGKRAGTIVHSEQPFNAEPSPGDLGESSVTPADAFYVRNHGAVPEVDPAGWRLRVGGLVQRELELDLDALREGFEARELMATLQCAGNRRSGLLAVRDIPGEEPWGPGATGTASWKGVGLGDVLAAAGPLPAAEHVAFVGLDTAEEAEPPQPYGASIPLRKGTREEVLLAWEMNGEPIPSVHGAPLRAVVPGYIGARSVKWLERIEVGSEPWNGFFQSIAYRLLPIGVEPGPGVGVPLGEIAVNSAVLSPSDGDTVQTGPVEVRGYAFAGGERDVARVDVSGDGGASWHEAELMEDLGRWAWRLWRARLDLDAGEQEIVARAWDSAAAVQPEDPATVWNPQGYVNNSWSRVTVRTG